jgi:3-deoxy-D-manno-octulosonic-acid transferase
MKFDQKIEKLTLEEIGRLKESLGVGPAKKILLAGSTHSGEESSLLRAFTNLSNRFPDLCLVLVPRDHERADEICRLVLESGVSVKKFSKKKTTETKVVVVDVIGVLARLYSVADVAFVGGSLAPFGGHNPLEPAAFEKPVIFGPVMSDFPEISRMLLNAKGAVQVKNEGHLAEKVSGFLSDPKKAAETGRNAASVFESNLGAVDRTISVLREFPAVDRNSEFD